MIQNNTRKARSSPRNRSIRPPAPTRSPARKTRSPGTAARPSPARSTDSPSTSSGVKPSTSPGRSDRFLRTPHGPEFDQQSQRPADPKPIISQLAADISGTYGTTRTTTTLSTTKPRTRAGQVQLTARVGSARKGLLPKGTVRFFDGDQYLGSAKVIDGGARLRTTVPAGLNQLEAVFQGTGNYLEARTKLRHFAK